MATPSNYNLGTAEAKIIINTDQFWRAESDARQAASEIEKALNRIVAAVNSIQDAAAGGQTDALKAQIESLKLVQQQIKATYETEKQLRTQEHKETLASINSEKAAREVAHKEYMAQLALEEQTAKKADEARRKKTSGDERARVRQSNPTSLERDRAGAQADSLLQVAQRNREKARALLAEAEALRTRASETTDQALGKNLLRQADKAQAQADAIEKQIEDSLRKINDLRKTARQEPVGYDLQTDRQRDQMRKVREETERMNEQEAARARREQERNARELFRMQDRDARAQARQAAQAAKEAQRQEEQLLVPDTFRQKLYSEQDAQADDQAAAREQLQRDIAERRRIAQQEIKEQQAIEREVASARTRARKEAAQQNQPTLDKTAANEAVEAYSQAMMRARAEQQNLRAQLSAGKAQAPGVRFDVDETELKRLEAEITSIQAQAVGLKQALESATDEADVRAYTQALQQLSVYLDQIRQRQAQTLANVANTTAIGTPPPNTPTIPQAARAQQNATRLAIAEAVRTLGEIETRFKAARVGLPISVDTTQMEQKIASAQVPIRELKTEFADLQRRAADALNSGNVGELDAVRQAMNALASEVAQVTQGMNPLAQSMDAFEARAKAATTGVRGYFNRLRIELERINQDSIGANIQQLGFNLLPMGVVAGAGVKRGVDTAMTLEETEIGFRGITGSASEARSVMAELSAEAERFGLPIISSVPEFQKLLPIVSQLGYDIKDFVGLAARLATLNPAQGIEGSVRAISELASGSGNDFVSIAERFNISRAALRQAMEETGKNVPAALEKVLNAYGRTESMAMEFGQTSRASFTRFQDAVDQFLAESMEPLLQAMSPLLEMVTGLFRSVNDGGGTMQAFTGILLAATAGAVTLTVALGQVVIALDAIKASFIAAAVTNPVALSIIAIAGAIGLVTAGIIAATQAAEAARVEAARAAVGETNNRLENLATMGAVPLEMTMIEVTSGGGIGDWLYNMRTEIESAEPILIPVKLQPEDGVNIVELIQRAVSGGRAELPFTSEDIARNFGQQNQSQGQFGAWTGRTVSALSEQYFNAIGDSSSGLLSEIQARPMAPSVRMSIASAGDSAGVRNLLDAYNNNNVTEQDLYALNSQELEAIARDLLGEGNTLTQTFMSINANLQQAEQSSQETRDQLAASGKDLIQSFFQQGLFNVAQGAARFGALQDTGFRVGQIRDLGGLDQAQRQSIMSTAQGMDLASIRALNEGLTEFAGMLKELNDEQRRTIEDRARAQEYEIADFQLQRQRTYEDYLRNQQRAEEDYMAARDDMINEYYKADAKLVEDNEERKKKLTEDSQDRERKALEDHLRDMIRMSRDVDDAIAARDFLAAQKQLQAMRDRQEDFDAEAEERRKDAETQLEDLKKSLEEQRAERLRDLQEQLRDAEGQYNLQRQRQDEDFRLSLAREDEDRRIRLQRQQDEYRVMDQRRIEDFNRQVNQLVAHNQAMKFNQDYWNGILEQDYGAFMNRIHQMIAAGATNGVTSVTKSGVYTNTQPYANATYYAQQGGGGALPADIQAALQSFTGSYAAGVNRAGGFIPQYADGVDFITREGLAYLHYGERVQTSAEAAAQRTGAFIGGNSVTPTINQVSVPISVSVNVSGNMDDDAVDRLISEMEYRVVNKVKDVFEEVNRSQRYE